jgi:hypothetical protein
VVNQNKRDFFKLGCKATSVRLVASEPAWLNVNVVNQWLISVHLQGLPQVGIRHENHSLEILCLDANQL